MPDENRMPGSGLWHLRSKKDPRWDRTGQYTSLVGEPPLLTPMEAQQAFEQLQAELGESPPTDLRQITLPYPSPKLKQLFHSHVFAAADKQTLFQSLTQEQEGGLSEVTLNRAEGVLGLGKPGETASLRLSAQFVGVLGVKQERWQWSWCSEEAIDLDPAALRFASIVKNYGIQYEIPELVYPLIPLGSAEDRPWFNVDYLLMATAHLCQADFYVAMPFDDAQEFLMFWFVQAPDLLPQPPSESRRFFDVIRQAMPHWASALNGAVGRELVRAYSDQKGYRVSGASNDRLRVDTLSGEHLFVQFDQSGNIAGLHLPEERGTQPEKASWLRRLFGVRDTNDGQ
jgi:hypothetical protein